MNIMQHNIDNNNSRDSFNIQQKENDKHLIKHIAGKRITASFEV